ncbi:hypothetical protein M422DRAFT_52273 [Sphaerobolus stellatus SS14]|uniref:Uncharacterized protein n=1 Tax=Sphaerobolus stellatus (strain SS14) TaxID=990650 RepID=A0A0C9V8T4_SPHS4|nr:hypothetical protein M422DRAFT_52273 [Sphaerobolus stellatus SS14]
MTITDRDGPSATQSMISQGENRASAVDQDVNSRCIKATDSFCTGSLSKITTILTIQKILPQVDNEDPSYQEALKSYIDILDNFKRLRNGAGSRSAENGNTQIRSGGGEREGIVGQERSQEGRPSSSDQEPEEEFSRARKRPASPAESFEDEDLPCKKINVQAFPWKNLAGLNPLAERPEDITLSRNDLLLLGACPQFPEFNLDHVLSGGYSISHDDQCTEHIGSIELVFGSVKLAKTVDTHGNWVIAWSDAVEAIIFVFPHCALELRSYTRYITTFFSSLYVSLHQRVIQFDRAIQIPLAKGMNSFSLTMLNIRTCIPYGLPMQEQQPNPLQTVKLVTEAQDRGRMAPADMHVDNGIGVTAPIHQVHVTTHTSVQNVGVIPIMSKSVNHSRGARNEKLELYEHKWAHQPRYARGLIWAIEEEK